MNFNMENIERQLTILKGIDWEYVSHGGLRTAIFRSARENEVEYTEIEYMTPENINLFGASVDMPLDNFGIIKCFCLVQAIINALESNKRKRSESGRDESA